MRSAGLWVPLTVMWLAACGGKRALIDVDPPGFVAIDLSAGGELSEEDSRVLAESTAECGDLLKLEPKALSGVLTPGEKECLEGRLEEADRQTVKNKLSRVLMADAWARGDRMLWETVVQRHLDEIDQSDPGLCYKFARHLASQGPSRAQETLKWANVALANRSQWSGTTFTKRVYDLYRIKAIVSHDYWRWLVEQATQDLAMSDTATLEDARNETKNLAREWLDYARASNKDPTVAYNICMSASGTEEFCNEGPIESVGARWK